MDHAAPTALPKFDSSGNDGPHCHLRHTHFLPRQRRLASRRTRTSDGGTSQCPFLDDAEFLDHDSFSLSLFSRQASDFRDGPFSGF